MMQNYSVIIVKKFNNCLQQGFNLEYYFKNVLCVTY